MDAITRQNEKVFSFEDGEETIKVGVTEHRPNRFSAINAGDRYTSPVGYGDTEMSAIADLFSKLPRAASEREERNEQAAAWDRNADLRKHGETV